MFSTGSHASKVFHDWAHQTKPSGKRSDGRVFFEGRTFYSYGNHYAAAYRLDDSTVLFNATKYSPTTSGHVSACQTATQHMRGFSLPDLTALERSGALESERAPREDRRKRLRQYIAAEWRAFDDSDEWEHRDAKAGALFLLEWLGERNPAAVLESILKPRRLAHVRDAAARKKAERKRLLGVASQIAKASKAARAAHIAGRAKQSGEFGLRRHATELFRVHRAASNAGRASKSAVWAFRKEVLAQANLLGRAHRRGSARHCARDAIQTIRNTMRDIDGPDVVAAVRLADTIRAIARVRDLGNWTTRRLRDALGSLSAELSRMYETQAAAERVAADEYRRKEQAERFERDRERRALWLAGKPTPGVYGLSDDKGGALVRAVNVERDASGAITDGTLQTSHGADVPLTHAIRAFRFVKSCVESGESWQANGRTLPVGHFRVDRVESSGDFKAGCHSFHWPEIERLARELGVFDGPGDDSALQTRAA